MLNNSLGYLLNTSARMIKRELDNKLKQYSLTTSQWALLALLLENNNLSQAEIADRASSDRATVGTIIDKLINKGFIQKELSKTDRRSYTVSLTEKGRQLAAKVAGYSIASNDKALAGIQEEEKAILLYCLNRIVRNLKDEN